MSVNVCVSDFCVYMRLYMYERLYVCAAWRRYIERFHVKDSEWHYTVDYICLNAFDNVGVLLEAMHDVIMY
jgi:hypothetical protein